MSLDYPYRERERSFRTPFKDYYLSFSNPKYQSNDAVYNFDRGNEIGAHGKSAKVYDRVNPGPPYRSGGAFIKDETEWTWGSNPFRVVKSEGSSFEYAYHGDRYAPPPSSYYLAPLNEDLSFLWGLGSTGMARAKPEVAKAGLAQMIGEAKSIPRLLTGRPSTAGREFGWNTSAREAQSLLDAYNNIQKHADNLRRNHGKGVRRERLLHSEKSVEVHDTEYGTYTLPTNGLPSGHQQQRTLTTSHEVRIWYVGKFRYHLHEAVFASQLPPTLASDILGLDVNAEVVWDLTPYSWLADWFGNFGDIISNLTAWSDINMVQEYGYVMKTEVTEATYEYRYMDNVAGSIVPKYISSTRRRTLKQRVKGFPYSFGPSPGSLTAEQASILASLKVSPSGGA